ncbi:hypothetical protein BCR34DRAFT_628773 [Clohesyomyces aquaticus]|uniref:Heterokaryon incompatibility domain-containing protein n=1 Tax=Clohesyomyces aquaticus TaxID=1231657 RepID=A0A1Y1YFA3_9PLEO|nr:hypothetical protein BCR34DRAFT_628773 [Clohesyomyces aquaticus]
MRLLHSIRIELDEFFGSNIPPYAILSHRWENGEVLFEDILYNRAESKAGWEKVKRCFAQAQKEGFDWVWIDTLCIDKSSTSAWFTRGWTLQELIAPRLLHFFAAGEDKWISIGGRRHLLRHIAERTNIDEETLRGEDVRRCSIAARMSWASRRTTTREEDMAYCLLGIFDVHMPLLYGEGERASFAYRKRS